MSESLLTVLKLCFLALLYLFLARVVRVVAVELKSPAFDGPPSTAPSQHDNPQREPLSAKKRRRGELSLRIIEPPTRKGETYRLDGELTVGRGGGCSLSLPDDTFVSQVHARVFQREGAVWIEDLGSTNGSFLNGQRLTAATQARRGDRVRFGQTVAEVTR